MSRDSGKGTNLKDWQRWYRVREAVDKIPGITKRDRQILTLQIFREGIPLPESSVFGKKEHHAKPENPRMDEKLIGPWSGALKAQNLSLNILGKDRVTDKRWTTEKVQEALKIITSIEADDRRSLPVTERTTTAAADPPKVKVTTLDKELRHSFEVEKNLVVKIADHCWDKMQCWIHMTSKEISGLGCVRQGKGGAFHVYDVFLFEQENTYTFTDIDDLAVQKLMLELDKMDEEDGGTRFTDMKFWWHSHAELDVKWSTQDEHNIEKKLFGDNTDGKTICPWWLSLLLNKKGQLSTRLDIAEPWLTMERISYKLDRRIDPEIATFCKAEYDKKVKEKTPAVTTYPPYQNGYHLDGGDGYDWEGRHSRTHETGTSTNPAGFVKSTAAPSKALPDRSISSWAQTEVTIPTPEGSDNLVKVDALGAYRLWEDEIIEGMAFIYNLALELNLKGVEIPGLAFRPTRIPGMTTTRRWDPKLKDHVETDDEYEWQTAGSVKKGDYILAVWPDSHFMHLSKITKLSEVSGDGKRMEVLNRTLLTDRFAKISIATNNNWEYIEKSCEAAVGIIFGAFVELKIPEDNLGEFYNIDGDIDENPGQAEAEEEASTAPAADKETENWTDDGGWDGSWAADQGKEVLDKDTATADATETEEEAAEVEADKEAKEEDDLADDMTSFATASHRTDIVRRIEGWIEKMGRDTLLDLIEGLEEGLGSINPEHNLSISAALMTDEEVKEIALNLIKVDHIGAFVDAFALLPRSKAYCPGCYEPLYNDTDQCPNCKVHVTMN